MAGPVTGSGSTGVDWHAVILSVRPAPPTPGAEARRPQATLVLDGVVAFLAIALAFGRSERAARAKQSGTRQEGLCYTEPRPEAGVRIVERMESHKSQKSARAVAAPPTRYIGHGPNSSSKDAFFGFRHRYM